MKNKTGIRNRKKLWTKIWSGILLFALLFHTGGIGILWESGNSENNGKSIFSRNSIQTVHAEEAAAQQETLTPEQQAQKEQEAKQKEMNESYAITPETNEVKNWPQGPSVYAGGAVVMDVNSGAILYAKNMDGKYYPASITKLLTTLVALENAELTDKVTFTQDSVSFLEPGDAHIGMRAGEEITLEDALYAVLLASANEVSHAVAESVGAKMGGDYDTFIQQMNLRSKELGCTNSHWMNANGLHDEEHYTTAHDMALIGAAVFQQEEFRTIEQSLSHTIPPTNLVNEARTFQQNHKMLYANNQYYYEYCVGGKTGFTDQAKTTLVTFADNGELQLVAVNLHSYGANVYTDTKAMFEYVFQNFKKVSLENEMDSRKVEKCLTENPYVVLPKALDLKDVSVEYELVSGGENREAQAIYQYKGQCVGKAEVVLKASYYKKMAGKSDPKLHKVKNDRCEKRTFDLKTKVLLVIGGLAVILLGIFAMVLSIKKSYRNARRRKRNSHSGNGRTGNRRAGAGKSTKNRRNKSSR